MFVCCDCCVLSGRGLCDELITRPEESYRVCCVVVWSKNLVSEEALVDRGLLHQKHINLLTFYVHFMFKMLKLFCCIPWYHQMRTVPRFRRSVAGLSKGVRVRIRNSLHGIYCGQTGNWTGFSPNTSRFHCHYHSTSAPYSYFICLSGTLYNFSYDSAVV
jgi:hypothetical protein